MGQRYKMCFFALSCEYSFKISAYILFELHKSEHELHPMKHGDVFSLQHPSPLLGVTLTEKCPHHIFAIPSLEFILLLGVQNLGEASRVELTVAFIQLKENVYRDIL